MIYMYDISYTISFADSGICWRFIFAYQSESGRTRKFEPKVQVVSIMNLSTAQEARSRLETSTIYMCYAC